MYGATIGQIEEKKLSKHARRRANKKNAKMTVECAGE